MPVPLSVLDLSPVLSGGDVPAALRNSLDLARQAETFGYARYWVAEHHFTEGVASAQPAVLLAAIAAATSTIRVGSGAVQTGHQTPLSVVEQFGMLDALYPGRVDLGLGRSGQRRVEALQQLAEEAQRPAPKPPVPARVVDGLLIPSPFSFAHLVASPRWALYARLLQQPGAQSPGFTEQVQEIEDLLGDGVRGDEGIVARAVPGAGARPELWILGSSGGESAQVAGARGLPFAANYHVSPSAVLEAVEAYRASFRRSARLARPWVMVSVDVVVAEDADQARHHASPYGLWVRSIRAGGGAIPFPTPEQAAAHEWSEPDRALVADRVDTQFVGTPEQVAEQLATLQRVTGADELLITTITHEHAARVRSFELLAKEWLG
ncbi:LLM class flavin-dependent oxidoreductase [Catellatospora citrea]|uniref:Putative monooxygenase (Luciferase-like) n=1 Tax=Catellatospora citrea TaxID=53366 RepID=A0A8J3NXQ1_9ACTN|nr:LLM class flavin-dependent oxidoreductase [Catellatospora citrea]RKE12662.1 luciferase family oxidoreductase group 1 [Catellatospora citrea]GIF96103.1 putative monooxygenase (luciferase-like) [Catellatospora citrea]